MARIQKVIEEDPILANDKNLNTTKNDVIMFYSFLVKLIELIVIIFSTCYLFCILWIIICEAVEDFVLNTTFDSESSSDQYDHFFPHYGFVELDTDIVTLSIFYFAFTSLTTVGFGDYYPMSEIEKLFGALMLLFGVLIFSYIMGEYVALLEQYKQHNLEYDEGDKLRLFFGVLKNFNYNE